MLFSKLINQKQVTVDLPYGVYTFDENGATGKTYLKKLLEEDSKFNNDILALDIRDVDIEVRLQEVVDRKTDPTLIIIDRYGVNAEVLKYYVGLINAKNKVILLDAKSTSEVPRGTSVCQIELVPGGIRVYN